MPNQAIEHTETSDPIVSHWLLECGILEAPVKFRIRAKSQADLNTTIDRLMLMYGDEVRITAQQHNRNDNEYVAYGAFLR